MEESGLRHFPWSGWVLFVGQASSGIVTFTGTGIVEYINHGGTHSDTRKNGWH